MTRRSPGDGPERSRGLQPAEKTALLRIARHALEQEFGQDQVLDRFLEGYQVTPRLEQVLYCELDEDQRELHDRLHSHWRQKVLEDFERGGGRATLLEALLRLRQVGTEKI